MRKAKHTISPPTYPTMAVRSAARLAEAMALRLWLWLSLGWARCGRTVGRADATAAASIKGEGRRGLSLCWVLGEDVRSQNRPPPDRAHKRPERGTHPAKSTTLNPEDEERRGGPVETHSTSSVLYGVLPGEEEHSLAWPAWPGYSTLLFSSRPCRSHGAPGGQESLVPEWPARLALVSCLQNLRPRAAHIAFSAIDSQAHPPISGRPCPRAGQGSAHRPSRLGERGAPCVLVCAWAVFRQSVTGPHPDPVSPSTSNLTPVLARHSALPCTHTHTLLWSEAQVWTILRTSFCYRADLRVANIHVIDNQTSLIRADTECVDHSDTPESAHVR